MPDIGTVLAASLDVRINRLEKSMARAKQLTAGGFDQIERRAKQSSTVLEQGMARAGSAAESMTLRLAGAAAALLSIRALAVGARQALDTLGDINDKSTAAGLDPKTFQTVATAAKSVGVEIDTTATALALYAKNSGLAVNGQGELVSSLGKLDPALLKSIQGASTQEERIRLAADALDKATDSAKRAALANALFGRSGPQIAAAFEGGGRAIDDLAVKLRNAGQIYDSELVQRSDDMGDKLDLLSQKIDVQLKTAFVNLGPAILNVTGWIGDWIADLNIVLDQLKSIEDRTVLNPLQNRLIELENRMAALKPQVDAIAAGGAGTGGLGGAAMLKEYNDDLAEALRLQERIAQLQGKPKDNLVTKPVSLNRAGSPDDRQAANDSVPVAPTTFDFRNVLDHTNTIKKAAHDTTLAIGGTSDAVTQLSKNWQDAEDLAQSFTSTLLGDFTGGKSAIEGLSDAIGQLGSQLLELGANTAIKQLFSVLSGGLVGGAGTIANGAAIPLGGFVPGLTGPKLFDRGGYTGPGARNAPAGLVHRGEVVWSQDDVARHGGPAAVDAMRKLPGFADGGVVGKLPALGGATSIGGTSISINAPMTLHAAGGSQADNADLARQVAREHENMLRGIINDELRKQMRPGNMLNTRAL